MVRFHFLLKSSGVMSMKRQALSVILVCLLAAALALGGCAGIPYASFPPAAQESTPAAYTTAAASETPAPTAAPSATATPAETAPTVPQTGSPLPTPSPTATKAPDFTRQEALDYFREIAFTGEYGSQTDEIRKWTRRIRVSVQGKPTKDDLAALQRAMDGLNATKGFPGIYLVGSADAAKANMTVWFVPLDQMSSVFTQYVKGNWGYFYTNWDDTGITEATVAIATDVTDQQARTHLIQEEVLQSTGLMQDSNSYPKSIYYGQWTTVQQPMPLDWELLRMLYMPGIRQYMSEKDAMDYLEKYYQP